MSSVSAQPPVRERSRADIRQAAERLRDGAANLADCRVFVCENIAAERLMCDSVAQTLNERVFGWSSEREQWWEIKGVTFSSPITIGARYESEPFWCNRSGFFTRIPNPALRSKDLSKFERLTGRKAAIVVPVHLPFSRIAAISFHPNDRDRDDLSAEFEEYADELEQMSRSFIIGYVKARETPSSRPTPALLNQREVECLQWAAVGKTDREIAQIIARSHATIRFHIRRAMEKLDAVNRSQAIFKAAQLGYLARVH
jgi:DNA-binding CsgD family transcriptional regulator